MTRGEQLSVSSLSRPLHVQIGAGHRLSCNSFNDVRVVRWQATGMSRDKNTRLRTEPVMHQVKLGTWGKQQNRRGGARGVQAETATQRTQQPVTIEGIEAADERDKSSRKDKAKSRLRAPRAVGKVRASRPRSASAGG